MTRAATIAGEAAPVDPRPVIRVAGGRLPQIASEIEAALLAAGVQIYQRGPLTVRPVIERVEATHGRQTNVARLARIDAPYIRDVAGRVARFQRFDARSRKHVDIDAPYDAAVTLLAREGEWTFRSIAGLITTPTLRADGTVLEAEGYDEATRLVLVAPPEMPPIGKTREDALEAKRVLGELIAEFPFVDRASESVVYSMIVTPVARGAFPTTPMHAVTSHEAGSGKSYACDIAAAVAIGQPCPVMAAGRTEEETEKRLGAALLTGQPLISIDNVNGDLGGDGLCQAIERPRVDIRILGKSENARIETRSTLFATGNNLRLVADMTRRAVVATLDPRVERPEMRQFNGSPVGAILADRGRYVAAALTIVRAYALAGRPNLAPRLASFEGWSDTVRSALMWLECADPVLTMEAARTEDPHLAALRQLLSAWADALGVGSAFVYTAAEVLQAAEARDYLPDANVPAWRSPVLRDAVLVVASNRGHLDARTFGRWLARNKGRIVLGLRLDGGSDAHGHAARWWVDRVGSAEWTA